MNLETIDQRGVADALAKRMAYPAQYMARPLVVWRSDFRDGVQEGVVHEVVKAHNRNNPQEEQRWFWIMDVTDENEPLCHYPNTSRLGFYVVLPATAHPDSIDRAIRKIGFGVPLVFFMPGEPVKLSPIFEQYVFDPDFEPWATHYARHREIMDFIRSGGDKTGIAYRWYNRFRADDGESTRGVDMPIVWLEASWLLRFAMRCAHVHTLSELDERLFRAAFREGISADVVDEFWKYIKSKR